MLIRMLYKEITERNSAYNPRAFYRTVKYLESNNLVRKIPEERGYILELTIKGRFLARMLAGFNDVEEKVRRLYGTT